VIGHLTPHIFISLPIVVGLLIVRTKALQAIEILVDFALILLKEQLPTEQQQAPNFLDLAGSSYDGATWKLLDLALRALNEQEVFTEVLEDLQNSDDTKRIRATERLVQYLQFERALRSPAITALAYGQICQL
jgi:hypothetical protein